MTDLRPGVRARPDWSFVALDGPSCRWEGDELTFLGFALGGVWPGAHPWLIDLKALTHAMQGIYGPYFRLGDRDLVLQLAVDARAEGKGELADVLAECICFLPLGDAQRMSAVSRLGQSLGRGRKSGVNPRISYQVATSPRLSLAFNPYHLPAGSPNSTGGQFTNREGATAVALTRREREENLQRMKEAVDRRPDLPAAMREAAIEIFDVEGRGEADPNGGAVAGITWDVFVQAKRRVRGLDQVKSRADLTHDQIVSIYEYYFDSRMRDLGGVSRLDDFVDRRTAIAIADTVFAHGSSGGPGVLRAAAESLLLAIAPEDRVRLGLPAMIGKDSSAALDVLWKLSDDGRARMVRAAIADQRRARIRKEEEEIRNSRRLTDVQKRRRLRGLTGWYARIKRFE